MPSTPKGLSDEKAARVLVAFREGRTLRQFAMRAGRFDAYCKAHPEYAREALPLLEETETGLLVTIRGSKADRNAKASLSPLLEVTLPARSRRCGNGWTRQVSRPARSSARSTRRARCVDRD